MPILYVHSPLINSSLKKKESGVTSQGSLYDSFNESCKEIEEYSRWYVRGFVAVRTANELIATCAKGYGVSVWLKRLKAVQYSWYDGSIA